MASYYTYTTGKGHVTIGSDGRALTRLAFGTAALPGDRRPTALTNNAATQLQEYLAGKRRLFDLPLAPKGTGFQMLVWHELEGIPYGETRTYSQVAQAIGHPGAARAVGSAIRLNPLPIFIPCHRVVPASGGVGGYIGGADAKRYLLDMEAGGRWGV